MLENLGVRHVFGIPGAKIDSVFEGNGSPAPVSRGRVIHGIVAADAPREEIRRTRDRRAA